MTITVDNASAKVYYTLDGTTPNDKSTLYTAPFSLDKTTTVTAIAYVNGKAGKTVSMKFEKIDESQILTVAEALKKADNTEVYVKGTVVSTQKYNKKYTNLNYWITDGGASTDTLEVYRVTYLNGADITNDEQIMSGDEVILKATITTYKNSKTNVTTRELTPSTLLSLTQAKETATITDAGWATFVSKRAVDFSGSNVNAYTVKYDSLANTITLTPIEKIPGKTAVVVKGDAGSYNFDHAESADALTDNNLEFKYSDYTVKAEKTFYILAQNGDVCGFYPVKVNTTLPAYKGYLYIKSTTTTKAKDFYAIGKTTTNINNAVINNAQRGIRYNLNGQRVSDSYKGGSALSKPNMFWEDDNENQ